MTPVFTKLHLYRHPLRLMTYAVSGLSISACFGGSSSYSPPVKPPVYCHDIDMKEVREDFKEKEAQEIVNNGKIIIYKNLLLVNEKNSGIHVFDNADPNNPVPLSYIQIPGNSDMAIKFNRLYANSYVDMLSLAFDEQGQISDTIRNDFVLNSRGITWNNQCSLNGTRL